MGQAKTLNEKEFKRVLAIVATTRYAERDRMVLLMSFWGGLRVGEIAALRIGDVVGADGSIKQQFTLTPEQTKGNKPRTVMVAEKLRKELASYVAGLKHKDPKRALFGSQRSRDGFSANTLCKRMNHLFALAGIDGASSHSGRRTFITTLANKGVGVRVLMALAGHRNIGTTQRYIDLNDELVKVAVNLI
ncbi:integrase [Thauera humireducens]|uniref:Integrase n=2 Tax=Thauera humireducens TaxID=1134435 RepID=A0A127KBG5_9RHOO|nr:integrase [Thauera humireducens]